MQKRQTNRAGGSVDDGLTAAEENLVAARGSDAASIRAGNCPGVGGVETDQRVASARADEGVYALIVKLDFDDAGRGTRAEVKRVQTAAATRNRSRDHSVFGIDKAVVSGTAQQVGYAREGHQLIEGAGVFPGNGPGVVDIGTGKNVFAASEDDRRNLALKCTHSQLVDAEAERHGEALGRQHKGQPVDLLPAGHVVEVDGVTDQADVGSID